MSAINASTANRDVDDLIADFNKIRSLYIVEKPLEVLRWLLDDLEIVPAVVQAYARIKEIFPAERLALEIRSDSEIPNWQRLWIVVYTQLDVQAAVEKLDALDDSWWLLAAMQMGNKLNITLEFT